MARYTYWCQNDEGKPIPVSITRAKQLLRDKGGKAWTEHCERDGTCFEVTEIELQGNNSQFKYNHHL